MHSKHKTKLFSELFDVDDPLTDSVSDPQRMHSFFFVCDNLYFSFSEEEDEDVEAEDEQPLELDSTITISLLF